jgi:hypothetical protein
LTWKLSVLVSLGTERVAVGEIVRLAGHPGLVHAAVVGRVVEGRHLHADAAAVADDRRVAIGRHDDTAAHRELAQADVVAAEQDRAGWIGNLEHVHAVVEAGGGAVVVGRPAVEVDVGLRRVLVDVDGADGIGGEQRTVDRRGEGRTGQAGGHEQRGRERADAQRIQVESHDSPFADWIGTTSASPTSPSVDYRIGI